MWKHYLMALDIFCLGLLFSPAHAMTPQDIENDPVLASAPCTDDEGKVVVCVLFLHEGKQYGAMVDKEGVKAIHDIETMEPLWERKPGTPI